MIFYLLEEISIMGLFHVLQLVQQRSSAPPETALIAGFIMIAVISSIVSIAICIVICYFIYNLYNSLPEEHQQMNPVMVWLLLIPCFNFIWNFFVFPKLSSSYQTYMQSIGEDAAGDCNAKLAMAYPILMVCSMIPCVNYIAGPATLVVLIIYLIKMYELKGKVQRASME
jgi:hypothetical protein